MSDSFNYLLRIGKIKGHDAKAKPKEAFKSFLCVELDCELVYIEIESVREVSNKLEICPLGHTQGWFKGIMKFQGDIFSVVDLRFFLSGNLSVNRQRTAVALSQEVGNYAVLVDKVQGIHRFRSLSENKEKVSEYIKSVTDGEGQNFNVLDISLLVNSKIFLNPALF